MRVSSFLLALLSISSLAGCLDGGDATPADAAPSDEQPEASRHPAWRSIARGQSTGLEGPLQELASDEATWRAIWTQHHSVRESEPTLPRVDFARERVVAVVLEEKGSTCWHASIENMTERGDHLEVPVSVHAPPQEAVCGAAMVRPFHFVAVETRATEATFDLRQTLHPPPRMHEPPTEEEAVLETRGLAQGSYSGIQGPRETLLATAEDWLAFWREHASRQDPPPAAPEVDFEREVVLAVVLEEKSSCCYTITIDRVVLESGTLHVEYHWGPPGGGNLTVMTQPHHFVAVSPPGEIVRVRFVENGPETA